MYPTDITKQFLEIMVSICLLITCILTPLNLAFSETLEAIAWYMNLNYAIDCFFFIDIVVNFNSAYIDESYEVIDDRKKIAHSYLVSWFLVDFLSIVPFELIVTAADTYENA